MIVEVKMSKNYLRKFIKYVKKVYGIEDGSKSLTDDRKNHLFTTGEAILP